MRDGGPGIPIDHDVCERTLKAIHTSSGDMLLVIRETNDLAHPQGRRGVALKSAQKSIVGGVEIDD
jgi:hypothetical protein